MKRIVHLITVLAVALAINSGVVSAGEINAEAQNSNPINLIDHIRLEADSAAGSAGSAAFMKPFLELGQFEITLPYVQQDSLYEDLSDALIFLNSMLQNYGEDKLLTQDEVKLMAAYGYNVHLRKSAPADVELTKADSPTNSKRSEQHHTLIAALNRKDELSNLLTTATASLDKISLSNENI